MAINGGSPKWLVYNGKSQSNMDDLGIPLFWETSSSMHILHFGRHDEPRLQGFVVWLRGSLNPWGGGVDRRFFGGAFHGSPNKHGHGIIGNTH